MVEVTASNRAYVKANIIKRRVGGCCYSKPTGGVSVLSELVWRNAVMTS